MGSICVPPACARSVGSNLLVDLLLGNLTPRDCPPNWGWVAPGELRNYLASTDEGVCHLQADRQGGRPLRLGERPKATIRPNLRFSASVGPRPQTRRFHKFPYPNHSKFTSQATSVTNDCTTASR